MELQDKYGVLIFRKTGLDNQRHIGFARQLGEELEVNPFFYGIENDRIGDPLLWDVSKYAKQTLDTILDQLLTDRNCSINLDGSTVQPHQRRWDHSLGNALWHTVSSLALTPYLDVNE